MKKALIIGSGGVGTITALALESSQHFEVTMVVRSDYKVVTEKGYTIDSIDYGKLEGWRPSHVVNSIDEAAKKGPYEYIFVSTKFIAEVQKTEDLVRPVVTDGAVIVLVQNGIGNEEPVMEAFPNCYVVGGVSLIGSSNYHGTVNHMTPDLIAFGTLDKRPEAIEKAKELAKWYNDSKSTGEFEEDLRYRRWNKLLYNSTYNTISALTQLDTGRLQAAGLAKSIVLPAMYELRLIAETELQKKLKDGAEEFLLYCDGKVYYEPSMLVDVHKDQPIELEALLGNPLRTAHKHGLDDKVPMLKAVYALLRAVQFRILEKKGKFTLPKDGFDLREDKPFFDDLPWTD